MRDEDGFGLIELVIAMAILAVGLMALAGTFASGTVASARAAKRSTAGLLADAQMESYRAMTSKDIAIDTSSTVDSTYKSDVACANPGTTKTCNVDGVAATETGPTGQAPDSCATINGWFPNTLPCTPSRIVNASSTPASPDGRNYRIDVYVIQLPAVTGSLPERARKQVTVVVRDGNLLTSTLARETSIFDCSTGVTPNSTDC